MQGIPAFNSLNLPAPPGIAELLAQQQQQSTVQQGPNLAPLPAPTGYEALGAAAAHKHAMAKALMDAGMNSGEVMRSPLQVLGHWAQIWAGKSLEKDADKATDELATKKIADNQAITKTITDALTSGASPEQVVEAYGADPRTSEHPIVKALMGSYTKKLENASEVGAPMELNGPDGKPISGQFDKAGGWHPLSGMSLPGKIENVNGVAVDLQHAKPGAILPQNLNDIVYRDPKTGQPVLNSPLVGAKESIAEHGRTSVSMNPYINAVDKSFGKVIPEATVADLTKSRDAALSYVQTKPELDRAASALRKGIIGGFAAGPRLDLARAADAFGITGKSTADRIANTQTYIQNMGRQTLPILQALRPASDTDVKTAQMMAGGDITLSPQAMIRSIDAARQAGAGALTQHRARVQKLQGDYANNPEIAQGLGTFDVPDPTPSLADKAAAELARRRGHK